MTKTEELIKDALAKQVTRAPDPAPILAALREPRFRRRTRPALVVATIGTALVTTAVLVPASMRTVGPPAGDSTIQQALPTSAIEQAVPGAGRPASIPMQYTLSPPDGYFEDERTSDPQGLNQSRTWGRRGTGVEQPTIRLNVIHQDDPTFAELARPMADATTVTINGFAARARNDLVGTTVVGATVRWKPNDTTVLEVLTGAGPKPKDLAVQIAAGVVPDGKSTLTPPLSFGSRLASLTAGMVTVGRSSVSGKVKASVQFRCTTPECLVEAEVVTGGSTAAVPPGGAGQGSSVILVRQPDGRDLRLVAFGAHRPSDDELNAMARSATGAPAVDTSWLTP
ncbi:hypothetical protein [Actinocrispum sp. NPDC049592]|uniref:hypothetical protein n=1 Tax=Actinocrispum sp. NPDC049592 TaxID=3154835 RepID=UPI00341FB6EB